MLLIQQCIEENLSQISQRFKELVRKKFDSCTKKEMVCKIKYKVLVCLESILEGNVDQTNLRKMMKMIPQKTLKLNLCWIYSIFCEVNKLKYTDKIFMFLETDDNKEGGGTQDSSSSGNADYDEEEEEK